MDTFEHLSREELVALARLQAQQIADLQQEVQTLRDMFGGRGVGNALPPFVKPNRKKPEPAQKQNRKKRAQAFVRKREEPTEEIRHVVNNCPSCGRNLEGGWEHSRHQVIDLPAEPVQIIDHVLVRRRCGICGTMHMPSLGPEDGVVGQHRVGPRLMSLVSALCTDYRVPREGVQRLLKSVYQVHLSVGEITGILHSVANRGRTIVERILEEIRRGLFVHADETGWREDGINGYLWSFSNPSARYFYRDQSRGGKIARGILLGQWEQEDGTIRQEECDPFTGVLICDFYSGYTWYDGPIQRCWDHFCRELKDLKEKNAEDPSVAPWVDSVFRIYERAKAAAACGYPEQKRRDCRRFFEGALRTIAKPYLKNEAAPQHTLAERIERFQSELFVFVQFPGVPSGNNPAERALRPTVIARKISGGTRSAKGSRTMSTLRTLFGTWALNGLDTLQACISLLTGTPAAAPAAPT